jgi:hypothetical protein
MSLNNRLQDADKCYFDPESNILTADHTTLKQGECLSKWKKFLMDKKQKLAQNWEHSFVEHISTYASVRNIESLEQLSDWDKKLISDLQDEWFTVTFDRVSTRNIPANTSVYVKLSR